MAQERTRALAAGGARALGGSLRGRRVAVTPYECAIDGTNPPPGRAGLGA